MNELTAPWAWRQRLWVTRLAASLRWRRLLPWNVYRWIDEKVWAPVGNTPWWKEHQRPLREAIKNGEIEIEWADRPAR